MAEVKGTGGGYADELAQYQKLQNKMHGNGGDRAALDAAERAAFEKGAAARAGGGVATDSKVGKIESSGNTSTIGLEAPKPEPAKPAEAPAPPPAPKKKKKGCLSKIGDALKKVAGIVGQFVPVVGQLMKAFDSFKSATGGDKENKAGAVIDAAKEVKKAADGGDKQSQLVVDAFKDEDKKSSGGPKNSMAGDVDTKNLA
jgi:hypothetical protein